MNLFIRNVLLGIALMPVLGFSFVSSAHASTLSAAKDTITTSRPSASAFLNANYATTDTSVTIVNNGSRYLASDSARFITGTGLVLGTPVTVASQSADLTGVYLANSSGTVARTPSDILIMPVTATHNIQFTAVNGVPSGGKIVITYPGLGSNIASPSATTFSFNGMAASNPTDVKFNNATCSSVTVAAPTITCTLSSGITAGTVVNAIIGCTTNSGAACTVSAPRLINPTKSAVAGTNDSWQLTLQTQDSGSVVIDDAKIRIATIDSVKVTADVDPSITFTIAGIASGNISSAVASCNGTDAMAGVPASTATEVSLGFLRNGAINLSGQVLTVSTNGAQGYTISATSSGQFINPSTGYWIKGLNGDTALSANDTPAPAVFGASGSEGFGISACGTRVPSGTWGTTNCSTAFSSGCKYSNPYNSGVNSFYATLASYTGGPVSNDQTAVKYAASISGTTPPGTYRTIFTYVATATF